MVHLKSIVFNNYQNSNEYPFTMPWLKGTEELLLNEDVVIFTGDNGSGKSTLMKLLADALNLYRIQSSDFEGLKSFNKNLKIIKPLFQTSRPLGYFFEAEAFITYLHYLQKVKQEAIRELSNIDIEYKNKSEYSKIQAKTPYAKTLYELDNMYEYDLTKRSHGEAYLDFFASRMKPGQLLLLDEPETPLSSQNQLTLLAMIKQAVEAKCQLIIATHSPILMSYPNALLYEIQPSGIRKVHYDDIESIKLLKQFINSPEQFLRHL